MKTKLIVLMAVALIFTGAAKAQGYNDHGYGYNQYHRDYRHERGGFYREVPRVHFIPAPVIPVFRPRFYEGRDWRYDHRYRDHEFRGRRDRY